jgi:hypothetical protein
LKELWELEAALLKNIGNYPKLRAERDLGEMRMTEAASVTFDYLGHMTLCYLPQFSKWIEYLTREHRPLVEELARLGSHRARELLGIDQLEHLPAVPDADLDRLLSRGIRFYDTARIPLSVSCLAAQVLAVSEYE